MAKLVNRDTGVEEELSGFDVKDAIQSGKYTFAKDQQVTLLKPDGELGVTDGQTAYELLSDDFSGYQYKSEERYKLEKARQEYNTIGEEVTTAAEGFARGATVGLSDVILEKTGAVDPEAREMRQKINPFISGSSELAGATSPLPTKTFAPLKFIGAPTRAVDRAGKAVESFTRTALSKTAPKTVKKAAELGTRGAVEGGLYSAGIGLSEQALGEPTFNGELLAGQIADGIAFGGGAGSVLGAGARAAEIGARKIKQRVAKSLAKDVGMMTDDVKNPMIMDEQNLKLVETPEVNGGNSVLLFPDHKTGSYSYNDGKKLLQLNPDDMPDDIIFPGAKKSPNQEQLDEIGAFLSLDDLTERYSQKYEPKEMTFRDFLKLEVEGEILKQKGASLKGIPGAKKRLEGVRKGLKKAQEENLNLKQQYANGNVAAKKKFKKSSDKVSRLLKGYKKIKKEYDQMVGEALKLNKTALKDINTKIDGIFQRANGIFENEKLYIFKPESIKKALHGGKRLDKFVKDSKRASTGTQAALRVAGAQRKFFKDTPRKKQEEIADYIKEQMGINYNRKVLSHPMFTALDDLYENVNVDMQSAVDSMENATTRASNYLLQTGQETGATGAKISRFINENYVTPFKNVKTNEIDPAMAKDVEMFQEYATNIKNYTRKKMPDGTLTQVSLTPAEIRAQKTSLQTKQRDFMKSGDVAKARFYGDVAKYLDEMLVETVEKFDDAGDIVRMYEDGKRRYHLGSSTIELINGKLATEERKAAFKFGTFGQTTTAAGGGAIGGVPGAFAALALKSFTEQYGDNVLALYADKIISYRDTISRKATSSIKKFTANDYPVLRTAIVVRGQYTDKEYRRDEKKFFSGEMSPERVSEEFRRNNETLLGGMPDTAMATQEAVLRGQAFLVDKFPKSPYDAPGYNFTPTQRDLAKFDRYRRAIASPNEFFNQLEAGYVSQEAVEATQVVYPEIYNMAKQEFINIAADKKLTYPQRQTAKKVFGIDMNYYQTQGANEIMSALGQQQRQYMPDGEFSAGEQTKVGKQDNVENARTATQDMMK